jgi:uncharacterized protein (TIGR03435 family)
MITERAPSTLNVVVGLLSVAAGLTILVMPSAGQAIGTATTKSPSPADAAYVATMTFDVASVRENKEIDVNRGFTMLSGGFVPHTSTLRVINWQIENLISEAYGVDRFQILDLPNWRWPTLFVIEAKGNSETDAKLATLSEEQQWTEQKHMLQTLLEDRFKLKTHWETKEGDVYDLIVAKGGAKLGAAGSMPRSADELKSLADHQVPPLLQKNDGQGYDFIGHACSMTDLVTMLSSQFGRPVIDKTGLTDRYDFVLKFKGRWDRDRPADDLDPMPPMDRALQEQLGLKVEAVKGRPVKVLVIDHIEKPSDN